MAWCVSEVIDPRKSDLRGFALVKNWEYNELQGFVKKYFWVSLY